MRRAHEDHLAGRGQFLGCENYPTCKNTRPILSDEIKTLAAETACPACGAKPLTPKKGRYGEYLHCEQCGKNHSLRAGLRRRGHGNGRRGLPRVRRAPAGKARWALGAVLPLPGLQKNLSAKKMAATLGEAGEGDAP